MFKKNLRILLLSRLFFILSALVAIYFLPQRNGYLGSNNDPLAPYLLWIWSNFDGQHFLNIASLGYTNYDFAYFPFYPALINFISSIIPISKLEIALLISLSSFFISSFFIYKITKLDFKQNIVSLTLLFFAFFPVSFYYHSVYTDSLFLLLTTITFYLARKGNWYLSGIFGGLATLTRLSGLALIPALIIEWCLQNRHIIKNGYYLLPKIITQLIPLMLLTISGFAIYLIYLQINHGDFLLFQKSMVAWQQSNFTFIPIIFLRYLKIFLFVSPSLLEYWIAVFELISFIGYMFLAIYTFRKIRPSYGIFMIVLLLMAPTTGTLSSTPRYILHIFPSFIALALIASHHPRLKIIFLLIFLILGFLFTMLFTRGYFVA